MLAKLKNALILIVLCLPMGCQTGGYFATEEAYVPVDDFADRLAKDIIVSVQNNFPPAKTRLYFPHGKEKLALLLEERFRKYGYGIVSDQKSRQPGDIQIGYKLDSIENSIIMLRVVVGEHFQVNRIYQKDKDGSFIVSGPTLLRKG